LSIGISSERHDSVWLPRERYSFGPVKELVARKIVGGFAAENQGQVLEPCREYWKEMRC